MQDFRAEIRQFRGFSKGELRDESRRRNDPGIGGQHAVHIRPDLNFAGANACADDRPGIVRPTAPERRRMSVDRRAHEAAEHGNAPGINYCAHRRSQRGVGFGRQRQRARVIAGGDDGAPRVHPFRWNVRARQGSCDDA